MRQKPWALILIGLAHLIEPVPKLLLYAWLNGQSPYMLFWRMVHGLPLDQLLSFFLSYPLVGVAILAFRRWSLPVVFGLVGISLWVNTKIWFQTNNYPVIVLIGIFEANLLLIAYMALPSVRALYLEKRLRWWEVPTRFKTKIPATIAVGKKKYKATILDMSEGGILLKTRTAVGQTDDLVVSFDAQNESFQYHAKVIHRNKIAPKTVGIQITKETEGSENRKRLRGLVKKLEQSGCEATVEKVPWHQNLWQGIKKFAKSGKGIFPNTKV